MDWKAMVTCSTVIPILLLIGVAVIVWCALRSRLKTKGFASMPCPGMARIVTREDDTTSLVSLEMEQDSPNQNHQPPSYNRIVDEQAIFTISVGDRSGQEASPPSYHSNMRLELIGE